MNRYDVKAILESNTLPIGGGAAKRLKEAQALESSRKREQEMIALAGSNFQYGISSNSSRIQLQGYPLMQFEQHAQQNLYDSSTQDATSFDQSYIQTQLQLQQQQSGGFYNYDGSFVQNNPSLMNMGVIDNNGGGGYIGNMNGVGMSLNCGNNNVVGEHAAEEVAYVKVDYDMPSGNYGGWSGADASNAGVLTMWNDLSN
jgi:AP2-like factor, ANT lineage